jgi:hypothetical protein
VDESFPEQMHYCSKKCQGKFSFLFLLRYQFSWWGKITTFSFENQTCCYILKLLCGEALGS